MQIETAALSYAGGTGVPGDAHTLAGRATGEHPARRSLPQVLSLNRTDCQCLGTGWAPFWPSRRERRSGQHSQQAKNNTPFRRVPVHEPSTLTSSVMGSQFTSLRLAPSTLTPCTRSVCQSQQVAQCTGLQAGSPRGAGRAPELGQPLTVHGSSAVCLYSLGGLLNFCASCNRTVIHSGRETCRASRAIRAERTWEPLTSRG
jgi:hypothetical protein